MVAANFILDNYAISHARGEMDGMAQRYLNRGENAVNNAVVTLQRLSGNGTTTCTRNDRQAYLEAMNASGYVSRIGLVDHNGVMMCVAPEGKLDSNAILPAFKEESPLVGVGMLSEEFLGANIAVVSWRLPNNNRLFAEISPVAMAIDPGPDYLRASRRAELLLGNDVTWVSAGGYSSLTNPDDALIVDVASPRYPLKARIIVPKRTALTLVSDLKLIMVAAATGFSIMFVAIGIWFAWRPESEADDEFALAIRRGEFIPYYQPVLDIQTGKIHGCEVLMRWRRPDATLVAPGNFMPYAETTGHIFEMTRQLMRQTCTDVGELYRNHPDFKLSVNLFAGHFNDRSVIDDLRQIYTESGIMFQQIVVEVTERQPLTDMDEARKIISEIQALGIRVALDDVGTGHGGMAYLQKLGIDIIKIDKMFVDALGDDVSSTTIVDSMVELADNLGMGIIAEGVERMEQVTRLREIGVTAAQGYLFSQPLPAQDFVKLVEDVDAGKRIPMGLPSDEIETEAELDFEMTDEEDDAAA